MRLRIAIPGAKRVGSFIIQMILGICLAARSRAAEETLRADDPLIDANSPQLWALATDAIHSSSRNAGLERLRWGPATKANIEYLKKDLAEGPWGITNRVFAKLILLEERLNEFIHDGPSPEVFISEIWKVEGPKQRVAQHSPPVGRVAQWRPRSLYEENR